MVVHLLVKLSQDKLSEVSETISSNVTAYKLIRTENTEILSMHISIFLLMKSLIYRTN